MKEKEKKLFKWLFGINLIYAYPMANGKAKKKIEKNKKVDFKKNIRNLYFFSIFIVLGTYGILMSLLDFNNAPILLDSFVLAFILMSIMQNFVYFFNVFYESKDVDYLKVLPIRERTVFLSKLATVSFVSLQLSLPIAAMMFFYFLDMEKSIAFAIVFAILDFLGIFIVIIAINLIIMLALAKANGFYRIKGVVTTAITIVAMVINIVCIVALQMEMQNQMISSFFKGEKATFILSDLSLSVAGQIYLLGGLVVVGGGTSYIIYRLMSDGFYNTISSINTAESKNRKAKSVKIKKNSINKTLTRFNIGYLKDSTLATQVLVQEILFLFMIVVILFTMDDQAKLYLSYYSDLILPFIAIMGVLIGNTGNNIAAFIVSLDGYTYNFIKSLPISRKKYILNKIGFASVIQYVLVIPAVIGLGIFLGASTLNIIVSTLLVIVLGVPVAALWIVYDVHHLLLEWNNVTDLMTKVGKVIPVIIMIFLMMSMGIGIGFAGMITEYIPIYGIYMILAAVILLVWIVALKNIKNVIKSNV